MPFNREFSAYIQPLQALCEEAGAAIVDHYHSDHTATHESKPDDSPLTQADIASHNILNVGLARFGVPVLSEESDVSHVIERRNWSRFWMVDPLDGTREFLERTGEFTINIALIERHQAVLGLLYIPLEEKMYMGVPGQGAFVCQQGCWRQIHCRAAHAQSAVVLTSRRHRGKPLDQFIAGLETEGLVVARHSVGSALKFTQLAEGKADYYPRFSPCSEWDTAAGQALVEAAGGKVLNLAGEPLSYNRRDTLLNPHFVASGRAGVDPTCPALAAQP